MYICNASSVFPDRPKLFIFLSISAFESFDDEFCRRVVTAIERDVVVVDDLSDIEMEASLVLKYNVEEFRRRLVVVIEESPGVNACRFSANKTRTRPKTNIVDVVVDCSRRRCFLIIIVTLDKFIPNLLFIL